MSGKVGHVAVVTGGTGFVATHLVSQLLSKGYGVRATVRCESRLPATTEAAVSGSHLAF